MPEVYKLDYSEELLSHLCNEESWMVLKGETFSPELIPDEQVRAIYEWQAEHVRKHGQLATPSVLAEEFDLELTDPETAIGDLIDRMRAEYMRTTGADVLDEIGDQFKEDPTQIPKLLVKQGKALGSLLNRNGEIFGTGDFERARQRYLAHANDGQGPSLGYEEIDDFHYGMRGVTIVIGPPKTYKSWFMIKAHNRNVELGKQSWMFALELTAEETDMRQRCLLADVPFWKYIRHSIRPDEWERIEEASKLIDSLGVYKINKPPEGERDLDTMVSRATDAGADVIFIDQLQYVEIDGKSLMGWNKTEKYAEVLNRACTLAEDVPICIAHQFNRSTMNDDKMPDVKKAKGSSAIEETSTLVMGLWTSKPMRKSKMCNFGVLASRNSKFCTWEMDVDLDDGCAFGVAGIAPDDDE